MGFGLPAAIGAKLADADRPVVALIGDGGFLMSGLELLTALREEVQLVVFVFSDGHLNQIRLQQWREYGHAHAVDLLNPNFAILAEALGVGYVGLDQAPLGRSKMRSGRTVRRCRRCCHRLVVHPGAPDDRPGQERCPRSSSSRRSGVAQGQVGALIPARRVASVSR